MIDGDTLARDGHCVVPHLLDGDACRALAALWQSPECFRSHVVMQRHGYGHGDYRYFAYPLPAPVEALRQALYPALAAVANRWNEALGLDERYPPALADWLANCHANGQARPTPVEQRPRKQSRGAVVALRQGDAVAFAVNQRPAQGSRGFHRTAMRHGVSTVRSGERFTLGLIFHDAA